MPGLDGLRASAVASVVAYHLGAPWLPGGLLGVGIFFTLSGYLITDLLLAGWERTGRLDLRRFWLRRARRLLPALLVLLAVVVTWVAVGDASQLGPVRGAAVSGLLYVNNWWQIVHHISYFARFGQPSALGNLWSLAIEEQFYLVWPWVLLAAIAWCTRAGRRRQAAQGPPGVRGVRVAADRVAALRVRRWLCAAILVLAAASAVEMAMLYHPSMDPTRVYDGTDTRAFGLLVGAALAAVWPSRDRTPAKGAKVVALDLVGATGLVTVALLMWRTTQYSAFLYRGGMVLQSVATAGVILAVTHPSSRIGRLLGWGPARGIGLISYGIYLWHYPIIVLTTPAVAADDPLRPVAQVAATLALATASWYLVESPIRTGALGRAWDRLRLRSGPTPGDREPSVVRARRALAGTAGGAIASMAVLAAAGALPAAPGGTLAAGAPPALRVHHMLASSRVLVVRRGAANSSSGAPGSGLGSFGRPGRPGRPGPAVGPSGVSSSAAAPSTSSRDEMTSCTSVVHIGDSTSESLVSSTYLPPSEQLPAQYARVGVSRVVLEISGARSLVETLPGQQNGTQVAQELLAQGYRGCWVIALGTNTAANIAVGSPVGSASRIDTLLSLLHGQRVLWVNAVSLLSSGPYANANMQAWDKALVDACAADPDLRVYDWAAVAQRSWFISDGIHYNSPGSAQRAADFADALATAFPATEEHPSRRAHSGGASCLVR